MNTRRYILLSGAAGILVTGLTLAGVGFAQVGGAPFCSTNTPTVGVNQAAVFTATGGNGLYQWSGDNISTNNATGSQFTVSYPNPGTYIIRVMSNGGTATCPLTVVPNAVPVPSPNSNTLACYPASQSVAVGQTATLSASGGNDTYTWSASGLSINNPFGSGFSATYATPGTQTVTVTSGGVSASCIVQVYGSTYTPPTTYVPPGLPNTGGGYGQW